jgi:DNA-directed RNA polymerase specialized sigma24 family protein
VPDALTLLDREWETYRSSPRADRAVARWVAAGAVPAGCIESLMLAMQDRDDPDERDRLVYRLCVMASADQDACLVVLAALRPGLNSVAKSYCRWWGWEETASMTFAAALERVVTYPADRRERPAANIVLDVQNRLHRVRGRELTAERKLGQRVDEARLADVPAAVSTSPSDELADVVVAAVNSRRLSSPEAGLIINYRVHDLPAHLVGSERGHRPGTVRSHRRKAEQRLALITRSAYGLNGAA